MKVFLILSILFLFSIQSYSESTNNVENKTESTNVNTDTQLYSKDTLKITLPFEQGDKYTKDELILFKLMNDLRKENNLAPLLLNMTDLYDVAKKRLDEPFSQNNNFEIEATHDDNIKMNVICLPVEQNIGAHLCNYIKKNPKLNLVLCNKEVNSSSIKISIDNKNGFLKFVQVFSKKEIKNEENDNYNIDRLQFKALLNYFEDTIQFNQPKPIVIDKLNKFINANPDRGYFSDLSSSVMMVYYKDIHKPYNYVQVSFSVLFSSSPVVFNKTYFFKEEPFYKVYQQIREQMNKKENVLAFPKTEKQALNRQLTYWLIQDDSNVKNNSQIVELRWFKSDKEGVGVFYNAIQIGYGLNYVNDNLVYYNIPAPITMDEYIYVLNKYLEYEKDFQMVEFLRISKYLQILFEYQKMKKEGMINVKTLHE